MSSDLKFEFRPKFEFISLVDLGSEQTSCLTTAFLKILASVRVFGRVFCLVNFLCHTPSRTTRKCKETLLQVKERLAENKQIEQGTE